MQRLFLSSRCLRRGRRSCRPVVHVSIHLVFAVGSLTYIIPVAAAAAVSPPLNPKLDIDEKNTRAEGRKEEERSGTYTGSTGAAAGHALFETLHLGLSDRSGHGHAKEGSGKESKLHGETNKERRKSC